MQEKNITQTKLYKILQYVYYFLISNIWFLVTNSIFFIGQLYISLSISSILLYVLILIPSGPSVTALFFTMRKLLIEKDISPTKQFFKSYKENFWVSLKYWFIQLLLLTVLIVDLLFILDRGYLFLAVVVAIIIIFLLLMTINAFLILSTFEVTTKNLFIFSFLTVVKNFIKSITNLSILFGFGIIWYVIPSQASLFIFSVTVYYLVRNNQLILKNMEEKYSSNNEDV